MFIILAIQKAGTGRLKQGIHNKILSQKKENNLIHVFVQQLPNIFYVKNCSKNLECINGTEQILKKKSLPL